MGFNLDGKHGGYFDMNRSNWEYCLKTAYRYGWEPLGTVAPDPAFLKELYGPVCEGCQEPDYSEWAGGYFYNDWQIIVTDDDARAIAEALHRAIAAGEEDQLLIDFADFAQKGEFRIW
jgi:hypothetical protein